MSIPRGYMQQTVDRENYWKEAEREAHIARVVGLAKTIFAHRAQRGVDTEIDLHNEALRSLQAAEAFFKAKDALYGEADK